MVLNGRRVQNRAGMQGFPLASSSRSARGPRATGRGGTGLFLGTVTRGEPKDGPYLRLPHLCHSLTHPSTHWSILPSLGQWWPSSLWRGWVAAPPPQGWEQGSDGRPQKAEILWTSSSVPCDPAQPTSSWEGLARQEAVGSLVRTPAHPLALDGAALSPMAGHWHFPCRLPHKGHWGNGYHEQVRHAHLRGGAEISVRGPVLASPQTSSGPRTGG